MAEGLLTRLKGAIGSGDFGYARGLAIELSDSIKSDLRSSHGAQRQAAFDCGIGSLRDALTAVRVSRSHLAARLAAARGQSAYQVDLGGKSWSVEA